MSQQQYAEKLKQTVLARAWIIPIVAAVFLAGCATHRPEPSGDRYASCITAATPSTVNQCAQYLGPQPKGVQQ